MIIEGIEHIKNCTYWERPPRVSSIIEFRDHLFNGRSSGSDKQWRYVSTVQNMFGHINCGDIPLHMAIDL